MKIEKSKIEKLKITEAKNLDPVSVYLEDFEPGKGKIIIECYGKSWSSYWGAMSGRTISEFFFDANNDYLACKLANGIQSRVYESPDDEIGEPNHHYEYLCRIIDAVREALSQSA